MCTFISDSRVSISCIIMLHSRGMGVQKALDSKSGLQGHPRSLVSVPHDMPHTTSYLSPVVTMYLSRTVSDILYIMLGLFPKI